MKDFLIVRETLPARNRKGLGFFLEPGSTKKLDLEGPDWL
jgi:hypothetical protein